MASDNISPWAVIWGGANVWGEGKRALPKTLDPSKRASGLLCRGFLYRKDKALTPEGVENVLYGGGVQNPFPPLFSTPPMASQILTSLAQFKFFLEKLCTTNRTSGAISEKFLQRSLPRNALRLEIFMSRQLLRSSGATSEHSSQNQEVHHKINQF